MLFPCTWWCCIVPLHYEVQIPQIEVLLHSTSSDVPREPYEFLVFHQSSSRGGYSRYHHRVDGCFVVFFGASRSCRCGVLFFKMTKTSSNFLPISLCFGFPSFCSANFPLFVGPQAATCSVSNVAYVTPIICALRNTCK